MSCGVGERSLTLAESPPSLRRSPSPPDAVDLDGVSGVGDESCWGSKEDDEKRLKSSPTECQHPLFLQHQTPQQPSKLLPQV